MTSPPPARLPYEEGRPIPSPDVGSADRNGPYDETLRLRALQYPKMRRWWRYGHNEQQPSSTRRSSNGAVASAAATSLLRPQRPEPSLDIQYPPVCSPGSSHFRHCDHSQVRYRPLTPHGAIVLRAAEILLAEGFPYSTVAVQPFLTGLPCHGGKKIQWSFSHCYTEFGLGMPVRCPDVVILPHRHLRQPFALHLDEPWWSATAEGRRQRTIRAKGYDRLHVNLMVIPLRRPGDYWSRVLRRQARLVLRSYDSVLRR